MTHKPKEWPGDYTFNELVDWASGHILQELLKGNFRGSVYHAMNEAARWKTAQERKETSVREIVTK